MVWNRDKKYHKEITQRGKRMQTRDAENPSTISDNSVYLQKWPTEREYSAYQVLSHLLL